METSKTPAFGLTDDSDAPTTASRVATVFRAIAKGCWIAIRSCFKAVWAIFKFFFKVFWKVIKVSFTILWRLVKFTLWVLWEVIKAFRIIGLKFD